MPPAAKLFLIDGTAFCYRAFYAIRGLSTSDGRPTNAVYGFAAMLQALRDKEHPDYLAVAFDVHKPTFRHEKFQAYKEQRKPMPDPLISQIPVVKHLLAAYRIPVFERAGYEAEDVLATIAAQIEQERVEVFLVTGDKDALQLVNDRVKVYNPHKDDGIVVDAEAVRARYGVGPDGMVDLMALMGDQVDNIPGVEGIGEKTAVQLLQRFGSLERLYAHLDELESPARKRALAAAREQVALSRELATVQQDVPLTVRLGDLKLQEPDWRALRSLFRELEFKRLLHSVEAHQPKRDGPPSDVTVVTDAKGLAEALKAIKEAKTVGLWCWGSSETIGLAVATSPREAWVMLVDAHTLKSAAGKSLMGWLESAKTPKLFHDAKPTLRLWQQAGARLAGVAGDTMIAAYLLNPARTAPTLRDLADDYLDLTVELPEPVEGTPPSIGAEAEAFGRAACVVMQLHARLEPELQKVGLEKLYAELELPLIHVLAQMEAVGVALDVDYLKRVQRSMAGTLQRLSEELYKLAGGTFNLNSPKQLAEVLFGQLKLPVVKRTKTGPSTDNHVLQQLAKQHPFPRRLIEYRELSKLVSTYVEALPKLVDPRTGRVHTSFNQTATTTGRLSSSDPNLQNIPIKTELGRSIRKAFIAGLPHGLLVAADYSQIELRILAHVCQDERLLDAFRQGHDIHRFTASLIYGVPEAEVQPEQRNAMKAVNFGILYGMTAHGLSKELEISYEEAQAFIDAYFERYPKVRLYLDEQIEKATREGYVETLFGRRRYIPELRSLDAILRQVGQRMAVNAPLQGTAADLIKRAMVDLARQLEQRKMRSRLLVQVHDELVCESPKGECSELIALMRRVMEGAASLTVPLLVSVKVGPNWLDMAEERPET